MLEQETITAHLRRPGNAIGVRRCQPLQVGIVLALKLARSAQHRL